MKVLNLYAGIGGNRKLWKDVDVTAVEIDSKIADVYKKFFPKDKVIVEDAHQYLLNHYNEFDFIWSSPPCQTHSSFRYNISVRYNKVKEKYPDMTLYQEILFLMYHFKGLWVVENVKPYYKPLIKGKQLQRHLFWSNFSIPDFNFKSDVIRRNQIPQLQQITGFDLSDIKIENKRQILRNCVKPELGRYVLDCALESLVIMKNFKNLDKKFKQIDESTRKSLMVSSETMHKRFGSNHSIEG